MKLMVLLLAFTTGAPAQTSPPTQSWTATWGASQQIPESQNLLPVAAHARCTLRQTVHLSAGGSALRIRFSNAFGTEDLQIVAATLAKPAHPEAGDLLPNTSVPVTFSGVSSVAIPPGADVISDPVSFRAAPLSDITVSLYLDMPEHQTGHPGSRATTWYARGDQTSALTMTDAQRIEHWYQLAAVDALTESPSASVVTLGDSITDGHGATVNRNERWPDMLASRLQASSTSRNIGVVNAGVGGNHLLTDGLGPNALARFDPDVLAPAGVRWVIVLEGINDLGALARSGDTTPEAHALLVRRLVAAYQQIVTRAHAHGLHVFGATITPDVGSDYYHPTPQNEADRQQLNAWIRTSGHFDAVIDFDLIVRDPSHPERLLPAFDSGDHLHPSPAGYRAMGETIPLNLFR